MPCPEGSIHDKKSPVNDDDANAGGDSPYEKLMHSLHHDPKWLQEVNLGRRVGLYRLRCKLGSGNFSQVKLAVHQLTKERVAIKIVDKGMLDDKMMRMLNQEISTMEAMHHPNLIRLYEVVETYSKIYLVMEYASGGELYNKVTTLGKLEEVVARNLFAQICSAVNHMHERNIIHRDIKAENVFFSSPNRVKLGDFGFSAQLTEGSDQKLNTFCGSPPYAAPELFCDENYAGGPVDVWALGILLYFMVVGRMPFKGQNVPTLKTNILAGLYQVPKHLSKECADLIDGIIQQKPIDRLTITSILASDWLKGITLPALSDGDQSFYFGPTVKTLSKEGNLQYPAIEEAARERLHDMGITSQILEAQRSQGSRSHIIGAYRIVVHRVQRQLSSFLDVEGCLPQSESHCGERRNIKANEKSKKFEVSNLIGGRKSTTAKDDLFLNCWRRKNSSYDSCDGKKEAAAAGESTAVTAREKLRLFSRTTSKSAKECVDGKEENSPEVAVIRSTTCAIL